MWPGYEGYCPKCKKHSYMMFDSEMDEVFCAVCYTNPKMKDGVEPLNLVLISRPKTREPI